MRDVNLCYLVKEDEILLCMKKRGFGSGKWNGFGGKTELGEAVEEAAVRETKEEVGVEVKKENLKKVAEIDFFFTNAPKGKNWDQKVHVFFIEKWDGMPKESEEVKPMWFNKENLPFESMWKDDPHWIHHAISGKKIRGQFTFGQDNESILKKKVDFVEKL